MDTVSKIMDWIYGWIARNNRQIEQAIPGIGEVSNTNMELDARRVRELADQNKTWMLIAKALHEAEDRTIRNILTGGGG